MIALLLALVAAPWGQPLGFHALPGWHTGSSGTTRSAYVGPPSTRVQAPVESAAWMAKNVDYRDKATADPPNTTLSELPAKGVIVWAVIANPAQRGQGAIRLDFGRAKHFACCDGAEVKSGLYELTGNGPGATYSVIVRIFFGSRPTAAMRSEAQQALDQLELPT